MTTKKKDETPVEQTEGSPVSTHNVDRGAPEFDEKNPAPGLEYVQVKKDEG